MKIAILDDYQQVALQYADWTAIQKQAEVTAFSHHFDNEGEVVRKLKNFDIICVMRERTPLNFEILSRLPELKLIVSTGKANASLDLEACKTLGIEVRHTGYLETGAPELTWALLLNLAKNVSPENRHLRAQDWQQCIGSDLAGKTIGIVGLGRVGSVIARYAKAFEMKVIAWSQNLTEEKAHRAGAELVTKERLFASADFVTLHLRLSERTRGIVGERELNLMKRGAYLVNTSRGPLVEEAALLDVLQRKAIAGAALDVFDQEPLPRYHPFRKLDNVLATPHIGYVTENTYRLFYGDTVAAIEDWLNQKTLA